MLVYAQLRISVCYISRTDILTWVHDADSSSFMVEERLYMKRAKASNSVTLLKSLQAMHSHTDVHNLRSRCLMSSPIFLFTNVFPLPSMFSSFTASLQHSFCHFFLSGPTSHLFHVKLCQPEFLWHSRHVVPKSLFMSLIYLTIHFLINVASFHISHSSSWQIQAAERNDQGSVLRSVAVHGHGSHSSTGELTASPTHRQRWMWTGNLQSIIPYGGVLPTQERIRTERHMDEWTPWGLNLGSIQHYCCGVSVQHLLFLFTSRLKMVLVYFSLNPLRSHFAKDKLL